MSSYGELYGGLLATEARHGYAARYMQQQAGATSRRPSSVGQFRVTLSVLEDDIVRHSDGTPPIRQEQDSYAAAAAAAAAITAATLADDSSRAGQSSALPAKSELSGMSPSTSPPRQRVDPSVSRPATTALAQATAARAARLRQYAQRQQQVQQVQGASSGGRRNSREPVLLSAVLQKAPYVYDRQRLSAVERFIDIIDVLPTRYTDAQVVFLSKNSLTSVSGLEQFSDLRVLGLADNLLADPEQLSALAVACPNLEALSLDGNPLAFVPHYRPRVLLALPGLKSLDGRPVTDEERAAAPAAIASEEATMAVLLRNACEVHKMASVVQRAQMHMELLHVMHSRGAALRRREALGDAALTTAGRSLSKLLEMWDYEGLLGAEERRKIRGALLREVGRMYRQLKMQHPVARLGPSWEEAFTQVMTAQQQSTAALLDLLSQCQCAMDDLVKSIGVPVLRSTSSDSAGEGRGPRELLLREAEESMERHKAMQQEREEVLLEFRDTALQLSRTTPRAVLRPALKSSLKHNLQRESRSSSAGHGGNSGGVRISSNDGLRRASNSGGIDSPQEQSPRIQKSMSPRQWQSARSSPLAPEAMERLMRSWRGVVPPHRGSSSSAGLLQEMQSDTSHVARTQPQGFSEAFCRPRSRSVGGSPSPGPDHGSRMLSSHHISPLLLKRRGSAAGHRDRSMPGKIVKHATGQHRIAKSMDANTIESDTLRAAPDCGAQPLRGLRSVTCSPAQVSTSPLSPPRMPVWRPAGSSNSRGGSIKTSPNYKDVKRAAVQALRAQKNTGGSPQQQEARTSTTTSPATAVAPSASAELPGVTATRHFSSSPEVLGYRHGPAAPQATSLPHAARSLDFELARDPTSRPVPQATELGGLHGASTRRDGSHSARLRFSSPTVPESSSGGGDRSAHAAAAQSRIDDLRRQVEESTRETARLQAIADSASLPLPPPRMPEDWGGRVTPVWSSSSNMQSPNASLYLRTAPHPPPWAAAASGEVNGTAAQRAPQDSLPQQLLGPWPYAMMPATQPSQELISQARVPHVWGATAIPANSLNPVDSALRPGTWMETAPGAPAASPQPQPQAPPLSLQPHRSSGSGALSSAVATPYTTEWWGSASGQLPVTGSHTGPLESHPTERSGALGKGTAAPYEGPINYSFSGAGGSATHPVDLKPQTQASGGAPQLSTTRSQPLEPQYSQWSDARGSRTAGTYESLANPSFSGGVGSTTHPVDLDLEHAGVNRSVQHEQVPHQANRSETSQLQQPVPIRADAPAGHSFSPRPPPQPPRALRLQRPGAGVVALELLPATSSQVQLGPPPAMHVPRPPPHQAWEEQREHEPSLSGFPIRRVPEHSEAAHTGPTHRLGPMITSASVQSGELAALASGAPLVTMPSDFPAYGPLALSSLGEINRDAWGGLNAIRASLDVLPPGSMQPSTTSGTLSHSQQAHELAAAQPYGTAVQDSDRSSTHAAQRHQKLEAQPPSPRAGAHTLRDFTSHGIPYGKTPQLMAASISTTHATLADRPNTSGTGIPGSTSEAATVMNTGKVSHSSVSNAPGNVPLLRTALATPNLSLREQPNTGDPGTGTASSFADTVGGTMPTPVGNPYRDSPLSHTTASMATPGLQVRERPSNPDNVVAATSGATTFVRVVDGGDGRYTRVELEELVQEDSDGSKDQHIHVHIHPAPVQVPESAMTDASTPQLFLNGRATSEQQRSVPVTLPSQHGTATPEGMSGSLGGLLVQPGSPFHEALSAGNFVYEKIERIKPAGRTGQQDSPGESKGEGHDNEGRGRSARRSGRRKGGRPNASPRPSVSPYRGGRNVRRRDEQPGFGYGQRGAVSSAGGTDADGAAGSDVPGRGSSGGSSGMGIGQSDQGDWHNQDGEASCGSGLGRNPEYSRLPLRTTDAASDRADDGDESDRCDDVEKGRDGGYEDNYFRGGQRGGHGDSSAGNQGNTPRRRHEIVRRTDQDSVPRADAISQRQEQLVQVPTELQEQYISLQRQLADQAAISAKLARQLQQLQGLVHGVEQPPQPKHAQQEQQPTAYPRPSLRTAASATEVPEAGSTAAREGSDGIVTQGNDDGQVNKAARDSQLASAASSPSQRPATHVPSGQDSAPTAARTEQGLLQPLDDQSDAACGTHSVPSSASAQEQSDKVMSSGNIPEQIQAQLRMNRVIQERIARMGEQLASAGRNGGGEGGLTPDIVSALTGLAATSAPLPPSSLRGLEQQLVALTLEKEAVERVLLQEQAVVRLLQQELGYMGQVADALEESEAKLQETRLAIAHQEQELQERELQLAASREREVALLAELASERERAASQVAAIATYFEQQFEEARTTVVAELREQVAALQAERAPQQAGVLQPTISQAEPLRPDFATHATTLRSDSSMPDDGPTVSIELHPELLANTANAQFEARRERAKESRPFEATHQSLADSLLAGSTAAQVEAFLAGLPTPIRTDLASQLESSRNSLNYHLAALQRDCASDIDSRLTGLSEIHLPEVLRDMNATQMAALHAAHERELGSMRAQHAAQLEDLLSERTPQPECIRAEYAERLAAVRAEHAKQIETMRSRHTALIEALFAEREAEPEALHAEYAARIAAMQAEHAVQIERMRSDHAGQLDVLLAERARQPEALRAEHAAKLSALCAEHMSQMETLRTEHAAQLEVLLAERAAQPEALRVEHAAQLAGLRAEHAKQMESVRSEHAKEVGQLLAERAAQPEALRAEHAAQLEAIRNEHANRLVMLRVEHSSQMETMCAGHSRQLEMLLSERNSQPEAVRAEHAAEMAALRAEHTKQMDLLRSEHAAKLEALAAERAAQPEAVRAEHAAQLAALRSDHAKQMDVLRTELAKQLELLTERAMQPEVLRTEHAAQLETVHSAHASDTAALRAEHAKQMETLRSDHAKQIERLISEHTAQPEILRARHAAQLAALRAEHAAHMEALRAEHAAAVAEKERQRAATAAAHEQQLLDLRVEHSRRQEELVVQHRQRLEQQDNDHRAVLAAMAKEHQAQLDHQLRRVDELLLRQQQQMEAMAEELEQVRRQGESELATARAAAERAIHDAASAAEAHKLEVASLSGRLRAAEVAEAAAEAARQEEEEVAFGALQRHLDDVLAMLGKERLSAGELRRRNQTLEVAEAEARRQLKDLLQPKDQSMARKKEADRLGTRRLLRRVLGTWSRNARTLGRHRHQIAIASELRRRRTCRRTLHHWRTTVVRTRLLRALEHQRNNRSLRKALVSFRAQVLSRRRKSRAIAIALAHWAVRHQLRCFEAWHQLCLAHAGAAMYADVPAQRLAATHYGYRLLHRMLLSWHRHVYQQQLPKVHQKRRAAYVYRRRLLRRCMTGLAQQVERRGVKRTQLARSIRRSCVALLNRAWSCWLHFLDRAAQKRALYHTADMQYGHTVMRRWRRAAVRSRKLKRGMAALQGSSTSRLLRVCLARWRAFLLRRRQSALAVQLASEHYRAALLWRCICAWLSLAQQSAARQMHIKGMTEYQRMMQAAMRWRRLAEQGQRQQAVVDRAVRLYRHRVLAGTQRAVLRHWRATVESRRALMRSAAVGFVHAFLALRLRKFLTAWHRVSRRAAMQRGQQAAAELRMALESNESALRQVSSRLATVGAESTELMERLQEARSEVCVLRQQLEEGEKRLAETTEMLANAQRDLESQDVELASRADRVAALEVERDMLVQRVGTLRQQVAAGEVSVGALQEQISALQRSLTAAQNTSREVALQMQQQAANYEEQLLAARDEVSLARREAGSLAAAASRLEQQAAETESQLRTARAGHESTVASLRQELRLREAHIMALSQQQRDVEAAPAVARPVGGARGPLPAYSPRPVLRSRGPSTGGGAHADGAPWAARQSRWSRGGEEEEAVDDGEEYGLSVPHDVAREQPQGASSLAAAGDALGPHFGGTRHWSTGSGPGRPARSNGGNSGSLMERTSLLAQPVPQARAAPPPPLPPPQASNDVDMWLNSPRPGACAAATAAAPTLSAESSGWAADNKPHIAPLARDDLAFAADVAEAEAKLDDAEAAAATLMLAAEQVRRAELRASEAEFQRRRSQILGLAATDHDPRASWPPPPASVLARQPLRAPTPGSRDAEGITGNVGTQRDSGTVRFRLDQSAGGPSGDVPRTGDMPPAFPVSRPSKYSDTRETQVSVHDRHQAALRQQGLRYESVANVGASLERKEEEAQEQTAAERPPASAQPAYAGAQPRSCNETLERTLAAAVECLSQLSPPQAVGQHTRQRSLPSANQHPQQSSPLRPPPQRLTRGVSADYGSSDGGSSNTVLAAHLPDLTAGIVGTLSNLRESLRSSYQQQPTAAEDSGRLERSAPGDLRPHRTTGTRAEAGRTAGAGSGRGQRTVTLRTSVPDAGPTTSLTTSDTSSGGLEMTMRDMIASSEPPPPPRPHSQDPQRSLQQARVGGAEQRPWLSGSGNEGARSTAAALLTRSLGSLTGAAAAATSAVRASVDSAIPGPPRLSSSPSMPASLRAAASSGGSELRGSVAVYSEDSEPDIRLFRRATSECIPRVMLSERSHEVYTRMGSALASVLEEDLAEAAVAAGRRAVRTAVRDILRPREADCREDNQ